MKSEKKVDVDRETANTTTEKKKVVSRYKQEEMLNCCH